MIATLANGEGRGENRYTLTGCLCLVQTPLSLLRSRKPSTLNSISEIREESYMR